MQNVIPVGHNNFDWNVFSRVHPLCRFKKFNNILAKLTSIHITDQDEETTIRRSTSLDHIVLSMIIVTNSIRMLEVTASDLSVSFIYSDDMDMYALCTGNLSVWKDVVRKLLEKKHTNELGQMILNNLDLLGYGGIFHEYKRYKKDHILLLEYRPC